MPTSKTRHRENKRNLQLDAHRCAAISHSFHSTQVMMASDQIKLLWHFESRKTRWFISINFFKSGFWTCVIITEKMKPEDTQPFSRLMKTQSSWNICLSEAAEWAFHFLVTQKHPRVFTFPLHYHVDPWYVCLETSLNKYKDLTPPKRISNLCVVYLSRPLCVKALTLLLWLL